MVEDKKNYSKNDVVEAWSNHVGRQDQYEVKEFENEKGEQVVQLLDKSTGSLTVEAHGENAYRELVEKVGQPRIERGSHEVDAHEQERPEFTERGAAMTPTQPQALAHDVEPVEVDHRNAVKSDNQKADTTPNQLSTPEERKASDNATTVKGRVDSDKTNR